MKRRTRRNKQRDKRKSNSLPLTNAEINHLYLDKFKLTINELKWLNKQLNIAEYLYFKKIWDSQQRQIKNNEK